MTTANPESFQIAWISDLKAHPEILGAVPPVEIRQTEYQSTEWSYPCIRVGLEYTPSSNYCGPDAAEVDIEIYSEHKSSMEVTNIASSIFQHYHGHPFSREGIRFSTSAVRKVTKPDREIPAWKCVVKIYCQGNGV